VPHDHRVHLWHCPARSPLGASIAAVDSIGSNLPRQAKSPAASLPTEDLYLVAEGAFVRGIWLFF
jgi:hypothetical protein